MAGATRKPEKAGRNAASPTPTPTPRAARVLRVARDLSRIMHGGTPPDATTGLPAGLPYALGPLTVVGVLSSTPGEGNVAPTAANALAPVIELMLTPGSCTTYPADVMPSTGCR